jgi:hypothetical protein
MKRLLSRLIDLIRRPATEADLLPMTDYEYVRMQLENPGYQSARPENGFF